LVSWKRLVIISLLTAIGCCVFWWFSPAGHQYRAMAAAQKHLDGPMLCIVRDHRAANLTFSNSTTEQIWVSGEAPTRADFDALRALIRASRPPVPVRYIQIRIANEGELELDTETDPVEGSQSP
jgi:hypothetical protein